MLLRCSSAPIFSALVYEGDRDCPAFSKANPLPPNRLSYTHSLPSMRRARSETDLRSWGHTFPEAEQQHLSFIQEMEEASTSFSGTVKTTRLEEDGPIFTRNPYSNVSSVHSAPSTSRQLSAQCTDAGLVETECKPWGPLLFGHGNGVLSKPEDLTMNAGGSAHGGNGGRGGSGGSSGHSSNSQGDSNPTDLHYQRLLQSDPQNPLLLRNYAEFLHVAKRDYKKAEEYYERAVLACPDDGEVLSKYAQHLWDVHKDSERAGAYFDRAVNATPENCYVLASYASFLWESDECEEDTDKSTQTTLPPATAPLMASA